MGLTASKVAPLRIACAVASADYDDEDVVDISKCNIVYTEALAGTPSSTTIYSENWPVHVFKVDGIKAVDQIIDAVRVAAQSEIVAIINEAQTYEPKELDRFLSKVVSSGAATPALLANLIAYAITLHVLPLTLSDAVRAVSVHRTLADDNDKPNIGLSVNRMILPEYLSFASRSAQHLVVAAYAGAISDTISIYPPAELVCRVLYAQFSTNRIVSVSVAIGTVIIVLFAVIVIAFTIAHIMNSHNASKAVTNVVYAHARPPLQLVT